MGQLLHSLGLPCIPIQITENRQESETLPHAEEPGFVASILLERSLHASERKPISRNMGQLVGMTLQRKKGGGIPG